MDTLSLPQRGRLFSYAPAKLVSPFGRDVAQRQRGLGSLVRELDCRLAARLKEQPALTNQRKSDTDLFACCSFRHGLRRATFLKEEGFF